MAETPPKSSVAVHYPHTVARVPFAMSRGRVWTIASVLIGLDLLLIAVHGIASWPETACARDCAPAIVALGGAGNLPSLITLAKLLTGAALCALMALTFGAERDPPPIWPLAAGLFFLMALGEILHRPVSASGAAVATVGEPGSLVAIVEAVAVPILILLATIAFLRQARVMTLLVLAAILFTAGHLALDNLVTGSRTLIETIAAERLGDPWIADTSFHGTRMLMHSSLIIAVTLAIRHQQISRVRYLDRR